MRHRKKGRKLNRTWEHRKAMFKNMAQALVMHERIKTTLPKAKELRRVVDRLVTLGLRNDLHSRRLAFKILENHQLVKKLFDEIAPCFRGVPGGYTRVVKMALPRKGDCARMAIIEFTRKKPVEEEQTSLEQENKEITSEQEQLKAQSEQVSESKE
ncbi:MAG: 50S ribosomal protein L17 [Desulfonauticus sp.]|nr:50S ribosomal protein L17 [Desulfonauticus sp.]